MGEDWGLALTCAPRSPSTPSPTNFEGDPRQLDGGSSVLVSNFGPYPNYPELYKIIEMGIRQRQLKAHKSLYVTQLFLLFLLHKSDPEQPPPPPKKSHLSRDQNPDSMVFTPNIVATLCMYVPTYLSTHPFQPTPEAIVEVRLGEARWLMNGQRHAVNPRPDPPGSSGAAVI